ncbi:MAG: VOC family protein [Betaproteobacteria bacterium]
MLRKIDCVMTPVHDLEAAVNFYQRVFGLTVSWRDDVSVGMGLPESDAEVVLNIDNTSTTVEVTRISSSPPCIGDLLVNTGRDSIIDAFRPYPHRRWNQGWTDAAALCHEIRQLGFMDSDQTVRRYLRAFRATTTAPPITARPALRGLPRQPRHPHADQPRPRLRHDDAHTDRSPRPSTMD